MTRRIAMVGPGLLCLILGSCEEPEERTKPPKDHSRNSEFDQWSPKGQPVGWEVEIGEVREASSWHEDDAAIGLVGNEVRISQLLTRHDYDGVCMDIEVLADQVGQVDLSIELDFGDDGIVEWERAVTSDRFQPQAFRVKLPEFYEVRFRLVKLGPGDATLARLSARQDHADCGGSPVPYTPPDTPPDWYWDTGTDSGY